MFEAPHHFLSLASEGLDGTILEIATEGPQPEYLEERSEHTGNTFPGVPHRRRAGSSWLLASFIS